MCQLLAPVGRKYGGKTLHKSSKMRPSRTGWTLRRLSVKNTLMVPKGVRTAGVLLVPAFWQLPVYPVSAYKRSTNSPARASVIQNSRSRNTTSFLLVGSKRNSSVPSGAAHPS